MTKPELDKLVMRLRRGPDPSYAESRVQLELDAADTIVALVAERDAYKDLAKLNEMRVIACGVAAQNPDPGLTRTGAYAAKWDSAQAEHVRKLREERDALAKTDE